MNLPFLDLLKQIAGGVVIYEPFRRDAQGLSEFQDTVHRLQEMERIGLVGRLFVEKRSGHGKEEIGLVMIQGGLTSEGPESVGRKLWRIVKRLSDYQNKIRA